MIADKLLIYNERRVFPCINIGSLLIHLSAFVLLPQRIVELTWRVRCGNVSLNPVDAAPFVYPRFCGGQ